jgi:hypothetical protein
MASKAEAASSRDSVAPVATFPMIDLRSSIAWLSKSQASPCERGQVAALRGRG